MVNYYLVLDQEKSSWYENHNLWLSWKVWGFTLYSLKGAGINKI